MLTLLGGSFGVVYKAIEKGTGEIVAIKHVSISEHGRSDDRHAVKCIKWELTCNETD